MLEKANQVSRRSNRVDGGRLHFQQDDNTGWSGAIGESSSEQVTFLAFPVTGGLVLFSAGAGGQTPPAPRAIEEIRVARSIGSRVWNRRSSAHGHERLSPARNTRTGIRLPRSRHAPVMVSLRMRTRA